MVDRLQKQKRKELSRLKRFQIRKWFDDIHSSNISSCSLDYMIDKIISILGQTTIPIATNRLYRCRPLKESDVAPKNLSDLLHPPVIYTNEGRCNILGKPALYVSDNANALVKECHLSVGQKFCLLQFDHLPNLNSDLSCILLGVGPGHALPHESSMKQVKEFWINFYGKEYNKYQEIESGLHKAFIRDNGNDSMIYKFTSLLCEKYFNNTDLDAIFYPSIANNGAWHNYAIRPNAINKAYRPSKVVMCELTKDNVIAWLDGAKISSNNDILWGKDVFLDHPVPIAISPVDLNNPDIYIHPFKNTHASSVI